MWQYYTKYHISGNIQFEYAVVLEWGNNLRALKPEQSPRN